MSVPTDLLCFPPVLNPGELVNTGVTLYNVHSVAIGKQSIFFLNGPKIGSVNQAFAGKSRNEHN